VPGRRAAIARGLSELDARGVLLVAGKGHERVQVTDSGDRQFSDRDVVSELLGG
jgi:UDP-N-acetylmuramyl tripeptide synthase